MHSDQMRKDGISEPMIQALYYDFVANYMHMYVKTSIYSTCCVQCNSGNTIYMYILHRCMIACKSLSTDCQVMPSARCKNLDKNIK